MIAFAERPASDTGGPAQLHVYIVNRSSQMREVLNDLDSINVPQRPDSGDDDPNLLHIDFGGSGAARFVPVEPGQCVKVTLLLREEQLDMLARVNRMKTTVRFRDGDVTTALLPAAVYTTNS